MSIEATVVRQIRLQRAQSRAQLAREMSVAPSTVGIHVDRLLSRGYLRELKRSVSIGGRPPQLLELHPDAGQFIGIDLDAHQIFGVSVDFAQRLVRDRRTPIRSGASASEVVQRIVEVIRDIRDRHRELLGIGLAIPGTVDRETGTALHYRFIRGWKNLPLARQLGELFGVPIYLENNVRAMATAERWFGAARSVDHAICLAIRTGIGAGILFNGEVLRGRDGFAGEIGRWPVFSSDSASPGDQQTLEDVASVLGMREILQRKIREGKSSSLELSRNRVTMDGFLQAVAEQDPLTLAVLTEAAEHLGRMTAQMSLLFNPDCVIVCGPLAQFEDTFLRSFRSALLGNMPRDSAEPPAVVASVLGELAGAFGAAALAVDAWSPNSTGGAAS